MKDRTMFTTVQVCNEEEHQGFFLDYYLLEKAVAVEGVCVNRFGIEICKRAQRENGVPYVEYRKIFDVFQTKTEACEMLEILARNTVTPISLKEILEDFLGISEFVGEELFVEAV